MITVSAQIVLASFLSRGKGTKHSLQGKHTTSYAYQTVVWLFLFSDMDICIYVRYFSLVQAHVLSHGSINMVAHRNFPQVFNREAVDAVVLCETDDFS